MERTLQESLGQEWRLRIGAYRIEGGNVEFRVWAPKAQSVETVIVGKGDESRHAMQAKEHGYFEAVVPGLPDVVDYLFSVDGKKPLPDPASRWQPMGVHRPSRVYDPATYQWKDGNWKCISIEDYIIYELHIGTFTEKGTFDAAIEKLAYLKDLGITAVEIMPVIEFPGPRNWGYDGVHPFAPHHAYGGPEGLKHLIDACHNAGLAVILDVVYNHLGPEGNYLGQFGHYFTDKYSTPWGSAVNFDGPYSDSVRQYIIDNALFWLTEYHADALRLDAIHAIFDFSAKHILKELADAFHKQAAALGRKAYLIAESDLNDVRVIDAVEKGGYDIDAQWSDDFHHAIYAYLTKSKWEYFSDFGKLSDLAKSITDGFVYDWKWSRFRNRFFGSSSKSLPANKFVICLENHDQIGNAGRGQPLGSVLNTDKYKLAAVLLFLTPGIPLIFMGQELNSTSPFHYFTSFEDQELAKNVREGYLREFPHDAGADLSEFDPQNPKRFNDSKLKWEQLEKESHRSMHAYYKSLIQLRKSLLIGRKDLLRTHMNEERNWMAIYRGQAVIVVNFSDTDQNLEVPFPSGKWALKFSSAENHDLPPTLETKENANAMLPLKKWSAVLYTTG